MIFLNISKNLVCVLVFFYFASNSFNYDKYVTFCWELFLELFSSNSVWFVLGFNTELRTLKLILSLKVAHLEFAYHT